MKEDCATRRQLQLFTQIKEKERERETHTHARHTDKKTCTNIHAYMNAFIGNTSQNKPMYLIVFIDESLKGKRPIYGKLRQSVSHSDQREDQR